MKMIFVDYCATSAIGPCHHGYVVVESKFDKNYLPWNKATDKALGFQHI
jgi:hypothetical protein